MSTKKKEKKRTKQKKTHALGVSNVGAPAFYKTFKQSVRLKTFSCVLTAIMRRARLAFHFGHDLVCVFPLFMNTPHTQFHIIYKNMTVKTCQRGEQQRTRIKRKDVAIVSLGRSELIALIALINRPPVECVAHD